MDTRTGEIRQLNENETPKPTEVPLTDKGFRRLVNKEKKERLGTLKYEFKRAVRAEKRSRGGAKLSAQEMKELKIKVALSL